MAVSLVGKTAVISGAYGGIGYAIASRFAREGARLVLLGRNEARLAQAADRLSREHGITQSSGEDARVKTITCDVALHGDWEKVASSSPGVDILVNCAGITQETLLLKTDVNKAQSILDTNLRGAIWGCKFVGKQMIKEKRKGSIINVSSLLALKGVVGTSIYAASKAGLLGLTTSLVAEYARFGIRVNAIVPGYIDTAMIHDLTAQEARKLVPLGRLGTSDEVADAAAFLAKNEYANNCILNLDGGLSAI